MPLLLIQNGPDAAASTVEVGGQAHHRAAPTQPAGPRWKLTSDNKKAPSTGATSAPTGPSTPTPTTTVPVPTTVAAPTATSSPDRGVTQHVVPAPTTSVTSPPTTTTTTPAPVAPPATGAVHQGQVTYYAHRAGTCASPWLPFGTVVRITNPANGESVSCVVDDREADTSRAIDLATASFAEIAPLSQGVIDAELDW